LKSNGTKAKGWINLRKRRRQSVCRSYGQPLARIDGTSATSPIVYFHNNQAGAPQTVSDQTQQSVWTAQLAPFGKAATNLRFQGQYYDQETSLHYNFNRYYVMVNLSRKYIRRIFEHKIMVITF
jgi:hypothetical protein